MPWTPPGVSIQSLKPGTHTVVLDSLTQIREPNKLAKFQAQAVYVATWKSVESAITIDHIIKFNGSKADFYAGLNIERMCLGANLPAPTPGEELNIETLEAMLDGVPMLLEVNDKGYAQTVLVPSDGTSPDDGKPF